MKELLLSRFSIVAWVLCALLDVDPSSQSKGQQHEAHAKLVTKAKANPSSNPRQYEAAKVYSKAKANPSSIECKPTRSSNANDDPRKRSERNALNTERRSQEHTAKAESKAISGRTDCNRDSKGTLQSHSARI